MVIWRCKSNRWSFEQDIKIYFAYNAVFNSLILTMLQAQNLTCERDSRILFKDLSFHVGAGEALRILGPNGSGKTTLLRIICGLFQEYTGDLVWDDESGRDDLLYQGHASGIKDTLTVSENLSYLLKLGSDLEPSSQQFQEVLKKVELGGFEEVPCGSLSAGQRKRVNLARFFLSGHKLWVMDEPFSAIDISGVELLHELMGSHLEQGGTLIVTSHQDLDLKQEVNEVWLQS